MEPEQTSSYLLSREVEGIFKSVNYGLSRGSLATAIGNGQQWNPVFDSLAQSYLDLIPRIENLAAKITSELEEARSKPKEEF